MPAYDDDIARLEVMVDDIRAIGDRRCEPKNQSNPRYHALPLVVSGLTKAAADMRRVSENVPAGTS